jgi:hypothetical protein
MALTDALTCVDPNISLDQLLNSIRVKDTVSGKTGLLTTIVTADTGNLVKMACSEPPLPAMQILRMAFGIDGDGDTTLVLIVKS